MLILGLLGMYFNAAVVFVTSKTLLLKLAVAILWLNFFSLISVDDIPSSSGGDGARAIASSDGKGAYLQSFDKLFKLSCDSNSCSWSLMSQKLSVGRSGPVLMLLPDDYNCAGNWENELHVWLNRIVTI